MKQITKIIATTNVCSNRGKIISKNTIYPIFCQDNDTFTIIDDQGWQSNFDKGSPNFQTITEEENIMCEIYGTDRVLLLDGIGNLAGDKDIVGDISVVIDSDIYTSRPIGKKFSVPIKERTKEAEIIFKYKYPKCNRITIGCNQF